MLLYKANRLVPPTKGNIEPVYYFSVGAAASVIPLTIINVKNAFPENHCLHDDLDMMFRKDSDLRRFDEFHNMYRLNHVIAASEH